MSLPALSRPEAERRHLTVLFCDLGGSTALTGRLDQEEYREVVHVYHQLRAEVMQRFDGYVAQALGPSGVTASAAVIAPRALRLRTSSTPSAWLRRAVVAPVAGVCVRLQGEILLHYRAPQLLVPDRLEACVLLCSEVIPPVPHHSLAQEAGNGEIHQGIPFAIDERVHTHARK